MWEMLNAADALRSAGQYEQALHLIQTHPGDKSTSARAQALSAECLRNLGRQAEAVSSIRGAILLDPEYAWAHYVKSHIFSGKKKRALAAARVAVRLDSKNSDYLARVAYLFLVNNKPEKAGRPARRGWVRNPEHAECGMFFAYALLGTNRPKRAEKVLRRLLKRHPRHPRVHVLSGWICLEQRQVPEALASFRTALRLDAEDTWAANGLREALQYRPRPIQGLVDLLRQCFHWRTQKLPLLVAVTYLGGWLLMSPPENVWLQTADRMILGVLGSRLAYEMLLIIGRGSEAIGEERMTRQRYNTSLVAVLITFFALAAWGVTLVTWGWAYRWALLMTWAIIPLGFLCTCLPDWRYRVTAILAGGYLVCGHVALWPAASELHIRDGYSMASVMDGLKMVCLLMATQFQGECETESLPQSTPEELAESIPEDAFLPS